MTHAATLFLSALGFLVLGAFFACYLVGRVCEAIQDAAYDIGQAIHERDDRHENP